MVLHEQHIDLNHVSAAVGLLAAIVGGSDDAIVAKNLDGIIISWNPAAERMFGYTEAEAIGQPLAALLIPDDHRGEDDLVMDRILSGANVEHYETERRAKSGQLVPVSLTVSALKDATGSIIGASKIMRDIAGAIEARRASQRLAAIVESSDDAMITKDATGRVTSWNHAAERVFGYSAEEAIGQHISFLFPKELIGRERDVLGEILAGKRVDHYETVRCAKDGRRVEVSLTVSPLRDIDGTIVGASKVARDITEHNQIISRMQHAEELARANERLATADRLKDQFLAMANHELRTPLTSIGGFTQTILDLEDRITPDQRREFLEIIAAQTERLTRMVDGMLKLSRAEIGAVEAEPMQLLVVAAARTALASVARTEVRVHGDDALEGFTDRQQFEQMLLNFVDNAVKYGEAPIDVRIVSTDTSVQVRVSDNGPGIAPDFEEQLFERFTRATHHAQTGIAGSGLGLAIVRTLAREQRGDAWYEPAASGAPAAFCFSVPLLGN